MIEMPIVVDRLANCQQAGVSQSDTNLQQACRAGPSYRLASKFVIPDASHHPNMEHPAQFNDAVRLFLASIPAD